VRQSNVNYFLLVIIYCLHTSCQQGLRTNLNLSESLSSSQNETHQNPPSSDREDNPTEPPKNDDQQTQPVEPINDPTHGLCRLLDFTNIQWPMNYDIKQQRSLALALTITGSYEGHAQWSNITNNFDQQGMSLGLLQQNFGSGSLQPLLFKMHSQHFNIMKIYYSDTDFKSLDQMILNWKNSQNYKDLSEKLTPLDQNDLFPEYTNSLLDTESTAIGPLISKVEIMSRNAETNWALNTVYSDSGKTFKPRWKKSFQNMANSGEYKSIQIAASTSIFNKAMAYFKYFDFKELRSFLFMYDVVVQNGSFSEAHKNAFNAYMKNNPNLNETQKALKLLEIRLKSVKPQYVEDVRSRKQTIINGTGRVHGENRNLPQEYCVNLNEKL